MTQAYNLAILANAVDSSGKLNVGTNASGVLPQANGGTGSTALSSVAVTSVAAGSGISVSASTGAVTISASGGGVTSLNGQTGAITNTSFNVIGSYTCGSRLNGAQATTNVGDTASGSALYNFSGGNSGGPFNAIKTGNQGYSISNFGRAGTWRAVGALSKNGDPDDCGNYFSSPNLWVRVS